MEAKHKIKIAIVGPESTGKSVLTEALAKYFADEFVTEYARHYFNINPISEYTIEQVEHIYKTQLQKEEEAFAKCKRLLICDTALLTGKIWCDWVFGKCPAFITQKYSSHGYDLYLLCDIDIPWVKDDQRKDKMNREALLAIHDTELKELKANYKWISGTGDQRLRNAIHAIESYLETVTQSDQK